MNVATAMQSTTKKKIKYWVLQTAYYPGLLTLAPSVLSMEEAAMASKEGVHYER